MTGRTFYRVIGGGVGMAVLLAVQSRAVAGQQAHEGITYAKHVAPILQENCQICHQPNSVAPMSLLTYEQAKLYAPLIKVKVESRLMPPWYINRSVGIQKFQNDRGLTDDEIETIVRWVDGGAAFGDEKDLPPPVEFPDPNRWQLADRFGEPDLIIKSEPYTLAAVTQDKWFRPIVETGLTEPRWVRAIEIKPSYPDGRKIVHHILAFLVQEEEGITGLASTATEVQSSAGLFMEWAVGKVGEIFPPDAGKLMLPGSKIRWEVHMHPIGEVVKDNQVELGVYLYPKDYVPKNRTVLRSLSATGQSGRAPHPRSLPVSRRALVTAVGLRFRTGAGLPVMGQSRVGKEVTMYASVRRYEVDPGDVPELTKKVDDGFAAH